MGTKDMTYTPPQRVARVTIAMTSTSSQAPEPVASMLMPVPRPDGSDQSARDGTDYDVAVLGQIAVGEQGGGGSDYPDHQQAQVLVAADRHGQQEAAHHHIQPQCLGRIDG